MKINIRGKNIQVTPALQEYVEKKIGKLGKFLETNQEIQVKLTVEKDRQRHRVEVTMPLNGYLLRGEEETTDMYASVDLVLEKLERQIDKYKTRVSRKIKNGSIKEMQPATNVKVDDEDNEPKVVKTKRFALKPMVVEEAIMQMNMLGHSFFVFSNADTEEINVLYRRKDGDYGLIEQDF